MKTNKIKESIEKIIELFKKGDIPKSIALLTNPKDKRPCGKWSLRNKMIMLGYGTTDARGFNQWKQEKRYVKKGTLSFQIIAPYINKICLNDENKKEKKIINQIKGFRGISVFRVEDTDGKKLKNINLKMPNFDLIGVADNWGIKTKTDFFNGNVYGYYVVEKREDQKKLKSIVLASPEEIVFCHELAHASHDKLGLSKKRNTKQREIVAEFVACVLMEMKGVKTHIGNSYNYLKSYSEKGNVLKGVLNLIGDIDKCLKLIIAETPKEKSLTLSTQLNKQEVKKNE